MANATSSWRSFIRNILVGFLKIAVPAYLGVLLLLMLFENWLVYHPAKADQDWQPAPIPLINGVPTPIIEDVELTSADGTRLHGWWAPDPGTGDVALYFHGNAGNLSHRGPSQLKMRELLKIGVLQVDYPGYGKSDGSPSEAGCYAAADAAYDWLVHQKKIDPKRIIIYGVSLGGGVAVNLASRRDHRALVLVKTFTSMPDVGQNMHPWLPVRWLMRNRFDSVGKIGQIRRPVFVAGSIHDQLIPYEQGQRLFEAANEPKEFFTLEGGHNDGLSPRFFESLRLFLRERAPVGEPVPASR